MLRERSSYIASFMEHPAYSIFKIYIIIYLYLFFWFATICQRLCIKESYSQNFRCSVKKSSDIISFVDHPVYSIFMLKIVMILVCRDQFITASRNSMYKSFSYAKFLQIRQRSSGITSFLRQLLRNILKVEQNMKFVSSRNAVLENLFWKR